jgi:hypothetical protein
VSWTRETWGYILWGSLFLLFAIPELLAAFAGKKIPFPTLSETVGNLILKTNGWFAIAIVAGFAVLVVHLVIPSAFNPVHYVDQVKK